MIPIGAVVPDGLVQVSMAITGVVQPIALLALAAMSVGAVTVAVAVGRQVRERRGGVRAPSTVRAARMAASVAQRELRAAGLPTTTMACATQSELPSRS